MQNLNTKLVWLLFFIIFIHSVTVFAQFYEPSQDEWAIISEQVKGISGLTWFGLAILSVQGLFFICRTAIGDLLGIHRLLILSVLSVIVTIGTKIVRGEAISSALIDSSTLMAYQVLAHQLVIQFGKRKRDAEDLDSIVVDTRE